MLIYNDIFFFSNDASRQKWGFFKGSYQSALHTSSFNLGACPC